ILEIKYPRLMLIYYRLQGRNCQVCLDVWIHHLQGETPTWKTTRRCHLNRPLTRGNTQRPTRDIRLPCKTTRRCHLNRPLTRNNTQHPTRDIHFPRKATRRCHPTSPINRYPLSPIKDSCQVRNQPDHGGCCAGAGG